MKNSALVVSLLFSVGTYAADMTEVQKYLEAEAAKRDKKAPGYEMRAKAGDVGAQLALGNYYRDKLRPTPRDSELMIHWYEKAAANNQVEKDRGCGDAHAELGRYYCGELCLPDMKNAKDDYTRDLFTRWIAEIKKHHVQPNYNKSYVHYTLAAIPFFLDFDAYTEKLAEHMTEEDVEEADKQVRYWKRYYREHMQ